MVIRALFTTVIWMVLGLEPTLAGTRDPHTPDEKYVEFGRQFPMVQRFRAVVLVPDAENPAEPKVQLQYGSAVIIRPHWVLTAAHMTKDTTLPTLLKEDEEYALTHVVWPKEYEADNVGFADIALCYSPEDLQLEFYPPLYRDADEVGKAVTIAGYGITGTFHTGCTISDGKKRAGHNKLDYLDRAVVVCQPSRGAERFPLEFMLAPGDSGGGMFIGNALAGINSFVMAEDGNPNGTYTDESAFTRVSLYANWVESEIEKYEHALQARATMAAELE